MKKILFLFFLTSFMGFSQSFSNSYNIGRAIYNDAPIKVKGHVELSDSIIKIDFKNKKTKPQIFKVIDVLKGIDKCQYTATLKGNISSVKTRITIQKNDIYKKYPIMLSLEAKDEFTGKESKLIYLLFND